MNYFVYGTICYLIMTVIVQYDNSHINFRTACWNTFVGPVVYVVMYPVFVAIHTYIGVREWIYSARQNSNQS